MNYIIIVTHSLFFNPVEKKGSSSPCGKTMSKVKKLCEYYRFKMK